MTAPTPLVLIHSVHFSYGCAEILHDVNFVVNAGEIIAITGANGSGKSTLLELIAGILPPDHGYVESYAPRAIVVQRPNIPSGLPMNVADVVAVGTWRHRASRARRKEAISQALAQVGLSGFERRAFSELSGGQRQRALIAQGLAQRTPVLLLDEPLASLDIVSRNQIQTILRTEADRGTAIVLVTHDQDSQRLADRTIRLENGRSRLSA